MAEQLISVPQRTKLTAFAESMIAFVYDKTTPPSDLKRLALLMTVNCVRNLVIEDYHSEGKLSDAAMKTFNQQVANKIYTFQHYFFKDLTGLIPPMRVF